MSDISWFVTGIFIGCFILLLAAAWRRAEELDLPTDFDESHLRIRRTATGTHASCGHCPSEVHIKGEGRQAISLLGAWRLAHAHPVLPAHEKSFLRERAPR